MDSNNNASFFESVRIKNFIHRSNEKNSLPMVEDIKKDNYSQGKYLKIIKRNTLKNISFAICGHLNKITSVQEFRFPD